LLKVYADRVVEAANGQVGNVCVFVKETLQAYYLLGLFGLV
jgi:hypothetical protein